MSHSNNPFVRGYDGLSVQRLLAISYDDDCPLSYLPLHVSQSHLPDSQIERHACIFCDDFALITEGQNVPPELDAQCPSHGTARTVVYAVMAEEAGQPLHVGDTYTEEAAREVVRRLRFETGFYSRAWKSVRRTSPRRPAAIWPTWPTSTRQPVSCSLPSAFPTARRSA